MKNRLIQNAAAMTLALANGYGDAPLIQDNGGAFAPGQIALANASRFDAEFYDEPLTTFGVGFMDSADLEAELEFFAPAVDTPRRFSYKTATNAEEFYSEDDDERALGAAFKVVQYEGGEVEAKTANKGLTLIVDRDEVSPGWEQKKTAKLIRRLMRNDLRRAISLLSAAATNTAKTWDTSAGKDPDDDVTADLITAGDLSGIDPNRVGYGKTSWQKRSRAHRAQTTAGGFASAAMTAEQVADILGVDQVLKSNARYQATAAAKAQLVNNLVLMFNAESGGDTEDASNIKRFVSGSEGGGRIGVYVQDIGPKLVALTVEHYSKIAITSTLGIRQFTVI